MDERIDFRDLGTTVAQHEMQFLRADFEQRFMRKLGAENCRFELFDLGTQLGTCYTNPENKKSWAVRIHWNADASAVDSAIAELRAKTGEG
jgi:hypothetical protein